MMTYAYTRHCLCRNKSRQCSFFFLVYRRQCFSLHFSYEVSMVDDCQFSAHFFLWQPKYLLCYFYRVLFLLACCLHFVVMGFPLFSTPFCRTVEQTYKACNVCYFALLVWFDFSLNILSIYRLSFVKYFHSTLQLYCILRVNMHFCCID